jgi:glyoxylase-like metal-dependent hydrolase (beta-lactamase superfamily II)
MLTLAAQGRRSMEITPRVHSIPAPQAFLSGPYAPNVYLVVDGGQAALIDAGYPDEGSIGPRLEYLQGIAGPSAGSGQALKLAHIIVTHHHIDHCGGAHTLRQATGARICLHPTEARLLSEWRAAAPQDIDIPAEPQTLAERLGAWRRATAQTTADCLVQGGDTIQVGGATIEVIDTPGHTLGSISLYLREEGVLFTGDTVLGLGTVAIMPPPHGDMALYMQSLERLKGYRATLLCPGHGPPVRDVARKLQELIDHRRERERQIVAAVGQGRGRLEALLAELYPELDRRLVGMARGQLLAHLAKLESEGRITRRKEGDDSLYVLA